MSIKLYPPIPLLVIFALLIPFPLLANAGDIAIYWGQNGGEGTLTETCNSGLYKYVNIAFLNKFGNGRTPEINLSGHCNDPSAGDCRKISNGIRRCQALGIKVMLSLGGGSLDEYGHAPYGLSSPQDARELAHYLWNNFLGGQANNRPLGDVILDGIDFDIEQGPTHYYGVLAKTLNELGIRNGRKVHLSAAPQCHYPDKWLNKALHTNIFDYVWIQFYNNAPCEFNSQNPEGFKKAWTTWTSNISATKFFVGLPASSAASSGFVHSRTFISQVLPFVKSTHNFGGVMLWDRFNDIKTGYSGRIKDML